jgi:hypothetical protein
MIPDHEGTRPLDHYLAVLFTSPFQDLEVPQGQQPRVINGGGLRPPESTRTHNH